MALLTELWDLEELVGKGHPMQLFRSPDEKTGFLKQSGFSRFMCRRAEWGSKPVSWSSALSAPRQAALWPLVGGLSGQLPITTPPPHFWLGESREETPGCCLRKLLVLPDTAGTLSQTVLRCGGCPARCQMLDGTPGLCLLDTSSIPPPPEV